ncbi:MAG TPA: cytochrome c family protein, partial [Devosia sp.]|nr:cytochrome c family protein [Devosia sp.]
MDSFELNKILGAILGTLLFVMAVGFLAEAIYSPVTSSGPGYDLPEPKTAPAAGGAAAPAGPSFNDLLIKADVAAGEASAKKCGACHDFTKGGPNKVGPNLYGVIDRKIASVAGFNYSPALKAHANETWTFDNMDKWLTSPKTYAPGTIMTFAGISDDTERANVVAYLRSLSDSPAPLPQPSAAPPAAAAGAAAAGAAGAAAAPAAAATSSFEQMVAAADPQEGASDAKKCGACHSFNEGGPNKVGPNLYDVVGRKIASDAGFHYSSALQGKASDSWSFDNLDKWLTSPKTFAPGTTMTFAGISDESERAAVVAYLRSLSHNPQPIAAAAAAPAPAPAAPAAGPAPAGATPAPATPPSTPAPALQAPAATPTPTNPAPAQTPSPSQAPVP